MDVRLVAPFFFTFPNNYIKSFNKALRILKSYTIQAGLLRGVEERSQEASSEAPSIKKGRL